MGLLKDADPTNLTLAETAVASVSNAPTGGWRLIVDTDGLFKIKDDAGLVRNVGDLIKVTYFDFLTAAAPGNPAAGHIRLYSVTGGILSMRSSAGVEAQFSAFPGYATPTVTLGTAHAAGTALTVLRSDATILAFDTTNPVAMAFGGAADDGDTATAARRNHAHAMPAQQAANADTSGASLTDLETEVNELKAALRTVGVIAT